jgi:hypothetical protein
MERLIQLFSFDEAQPLIFTQLDFWIFFLIVLSIFSFIQKHKLTRSIFLFVVSLFFYFKTSGLASFAAKREHYTELLYRKRTWKSKLKSLQKSFCHPIRIVQSAYTWILQIRLLFYRFI